MSTTPLRAVENPQPTSHKETDAQGVASQYSCSVTLQRYSDGRFSLQENGIAVETDIRVQVNGHEDIVLSRTPGDDLNLVVGNLFSRSMIRGPEDVLGVAFSYQGVPSAKVQLQSPNAIRRIFPSPRPVNLEPERLFEFKEIFERRQNLFKNTGSTHAAALFSAEGELVAFGEDVGRHNAFDKAIGRALMEGSLNKVVIAMLSSRLAQELAVKAATANIPILCGFSAATSSGVNYAKQSNLTLVGCLRNQTFNVYSNGWRIRAEVE